ncbi:hypothetical protein [Paenibacillus riograndensis]|uniref:Uncharacterized protein n=1 Tax=Paenibacillus riograndensis SBR5 TaxID=1073571 RepID=A0A0E4H904_9BACL|nr:hypothetical protein [Paenibacillus riograndensis]CQR54196.1 hypothetical protein PRIO_1786 [Paenibacillus riograndensis SBR5]
MDERLQFDGTHLTFQTALDEERRRLIAWHFKSSWLELQQAVRLTTLSSENKFAQFLFPVDRPLGQTLEMRVPRPGSRYYYADLGIIKKVQTFVPILRSNVLFICDDGSPMYSDWFSFQRDHASPPLLEQNTWWEFFTGYSLSAH